MTKSKNKAEEGYRQKVYKYLRSSIEILSENYGIDDLSVIEGVVLRNIIESHLSEGIALESIITFLSDYGIDSGILTRTKNDRITNNYIKYIKRLRARERLL